jgi:hypothetical protein
MILNSVFSVMLPVGQHGGCNVNFTRISYVFGFEF